MRRKIITELILTYLYIFMKYDNDERDGDTKDTCL